MKLKPILLAAFGLCMSAAVVAEHNNGGYLFVTKASAAAPDYHDAGIRKLLGATR